jgi:hypothetical protein
LSNVIDIEGFRAKRNTPVVTTGTRRPPYLLERFTLNCEDHEDCTVARAKELARIGKGDAFTTVDGLRVFALEERITNHGRELLMSGGGLKAWVPDTLFISGPEHVA